MQIENRVEATANVERRNEKLYMENTLLRISGALFCHDPKRAMKRTSQIDLKRDNPEKRIVVRPDPQLGQPGQLAHKIFVAIIKKHSDCGRPIQNEVSFGKREIMRMIGRAEWGGRDSEQLAKALYEIRRTSITAYFKDASGRYHEHDFSIFNELLLERAEFLSDPIQSCTIKLADPIIASLRDEHFTCLNHFRMREFGTIGQAIYMRLFFHFANLYSGVNGSRLVFQKRYDDVCTEWLGGLTVLRYKSDILKDQLGPHLRQLIDAGFLSAFAIEKAKGRGGLVLTFRPGPAFFEDYERFYRQPRAAEFPAALDGDRRDVGEPLKLVYLFVEKRTGQPVSSIAFASSKDVETAKQLLTAIAFDEMPAFLDYALAEARKTNFDIQTLGGVKLYVAGYAAFRQRQAARRTQETTSEAPQRDETERHAYEHHRRSQAANLFATLPQDEQEAIEAEARAYAARFSGSLQDSMFGFGRTRFTIERHGDKLQPFEQWKVNRDSR